VAVTRVVGKHNAIEYSATHKTEFVPYLLLVLTMTIWGSATPFAKIVLTYIPYTAAPFLRFALGTFALFVLLAVSGGRLRPRARDLPRIMAVGFVGVFTYNILLFLGLHMAPAIDFSIIVPVFSPIITVAVSIILGWESVSPSRIAGLLLGLSGGVIVFLDASIMPGDGHRRLIGDLVYLLAAGAFALYTLIGKIALREIEPIQATAYATLFGAVFLMVPAIPSFGGVNWPAIPWRIWADLLYLAVGPTAVAYGLYYRGIRDVGPAAASILMLLMPIVGAATAAAVLGESLTPFQILGSCLMLAGAFLAITNGKIPHTRNE
jgi:drug/metabolite transporter (DMT)-like permease